MRKVFFPVFLMFLSVLSIQAYAQSKPVIAFLDNTSDNNIIIGREIDAQFMSDVLSGAKFNIVTRSNSVIKTLISENELSLSGLTSDAVSQLRVLGVTYYVMFTILHTSSSQNSGTNYEVDYYINATMQVFNLEGQILVSKDIDEKGSGIYSYYSNQYGSGYNGSYNGALEAAQQSAVNNVANDMKVFLNNMILIQSTIIKQVGGSKSKDFIINVGSNEGVKKGMRMTFVQYVDGVKETDGLAHVTGTGTNVAMIEITSWPSKFSIIVGRTQAIEVPETTSQPIGILSIIRGWRVLTNLTVVDYFDLIMFIWSVVSFPEILEIWLIISAYFVLHIIFPNIFPL